MLASSKKLHVQHGAPVAGDRPVLVLGVDALGAGHDALHDMMATREYYDFFPRPCGSTLFAGWWKR